MTLEVRKTAAVDVQRRPLRSRAHDLWLRRRAEVVTVSRRQAWTAWRVAKQLPTLAVLLVAYTPRGVGRLVGAWVRYLRDEDTAQLRAQHAASRESGDYVKVSAVRSSNLAARLLASGLAVLGVVVLVLAWVAPDILGILVGVGVFYGVVRAVPRRDLNALLGAAVAGVVAYFATPWAASFLPVPPMWLWWLLCTAAVAVCGWVGRPRAKPLVTLPGLAAGGLAPRLTAPMVAAALCTLGNAKMREPDDIRLLTDPIRCGQGYQVDLELPPGVPATFVIGKREAFAAAIRRELGCVFLTVGVRHPGHLVVYVSDQPMNKQEQTPWPLMRGPKVDIFEPQPMCTDQRGEWVPMTFAYSSMVVGAVPRMGKTFLLRQALVVCALDPRVRICALDGKGTGDLGPLHPVAHFYSRGRRPEEIERVRELVRELRADLVRRSDFLDSLSEDECPESKVTSELASRYPRQLAPVVLGIDETQSYFEYGDDKNKEHKAIRAELAAGIAELVKLGPALGIIVFLASQNVTKDTIPRPISTNVIIRACLKIGDQTANDQVMGTSSYSKGIDATQFDFEDKGVMFLAADGARPQIVRSCFGLDAKAAKEVIARARVLRQAAGTLPADEIEDAVVVVDIVEDVRRVMADRSRPAAQHAELVGWLQELRPEYAGLTVDELSTRLRNGGMRVGQVWSNGRNAKGVDLRKQARDETA